MLFVDPQASREWRETELETRRMIASSHLSSVGTATAQVVLVGASNATSNVDDVNLHAVGSAVSEMYVCSCQILASPFLRPLTCERICTRLYSYMY